MNPRLHQIFQNNTPVPDPDLIDRVVFVLTDEMRRKIARQRSWVRAGLATSFLTLLGTFWFFGQEIVLSDFWSMFALAFSDMQLVLVYWKEFLFSLLELFPVQAVILMLIPSFAFILFLRVYFVLEDERTIQQPVF